MHRDEDAEVAGPDHLHDVRLRGAVSQADVVAATRGEERERVHHRLRELAMVEVGQLDDRVRDLAAGAVEDRDAGRRHRRVELPLRIHDGELLPFARDRVHAGAVRRRGRVARPIGDATRLGAVDELEHRLQHERERVDRVDGDEHLALGDRRVRGVEAVVDRLQHLEVPELAAVDLPGGGPCVAIEGEHAADAIAREAVLPGTGGASMARLQRDLVPHLRERAPRDLEAGKVPAGRGEGGGRRHGVDLEDLMPGIPRLPDGLGRATREHRGDALPDVPPVLADGRRVAGSDPCIDPRCARRVAAHLRRVRVALKAHRVGLAFGRCALARTDRQGREQGDGEQQSCIAQQDGTAVLGHRCLLALLQRVSAVLGRVASLAGTSRTGDRRATPRIPA